MGCEVMDWRRRRGRVRRPRGWHGRCAGTICNSDEFSQGLGRGPGQAVWPKRPAGSNGWKNCDSGSSVPDRLTDIRSILPKVCGRILVRPSMNQAQLCPACGLACVSTALRCDCGFNFATGARPLGHPSFRERLDQHLVLVAFALGVASVAAGAVTGSGGVIRLPPWASTLLVAAVGPNGEFFGYVGLGAVPFAVAGAVAGAGTLPFWRVLGIFLAGVTLASAAAIVYVNLIAVLPLVWPLAACSFGIGFFSVRLLSKRLPKRVPA